MATVTLTNIRKSFGANEVIHGVDVEVADGEFIVIVGPSGCGKSTLLRMVAGLETVTTGELMIGGERVNEKEPMDRNIAMVFQNYALYPHMSVFDNMAYGLKIARTPKEEIAKRVSDAAKLLQLEPFLGRKPRELSGGQRQRVAMGRAIVREPDVFLFDEPLSNLDAKLRVQMRLEIKSLQRKLGVTSLYVTHDQVEAMTLADRMIVMNAGNVEQVGAPLEVFDRPATLFVAGFIGSPAMNFVDARLAEDGRAVELPGGERLALDGAAPEGVEAGAPVLLGLRPEHVIPAAEESGGLAHMTVDLVEHLGADSLIHGQFGPEGQDFTIRVQGSARFATGERIAFGAASEHIHLFDRESGRRLG